MNTAPEKVPVLIVGAGPVGLAMAIDLGWRGIRCMLIDQSDGSINTPKLGAVGIRTMELCRRWGIAERIRNTPYQRDYGLSMVFCTTIAGHLLARHEYPSLEADLVPPESPEKKWRCPQLWFDPCLAECVRALPSVTMSYRTRLESFEDRGTSVIAQVTDLQTGATRAVEADFLVGCDGPGSTVRRQLGIEMLGNPVLDYSVAIFFRSKGLAQQKYKSEAERYYFIDRAGWWGNISAMDGRELWRLTVPSDETGVPEIAAKADHWVRRALGTDDISFEIINALPWRRSQLTAASYGDGRVLIAGDSAHTMSPTGGLGMNTGLGDVDNLGWKLQAALAGWAGPRLISSYSIERKPIGERNAAASAKNYFALKVSAADCAVVMDETPEGEAVRRAVGSRIAQATKAEWEQLGIHLGYRYHNSPIVVSDGSEAPPDRQSEYEQTACPGHRAPHVWLEGGSKGTFAVGRSTLDLFGREFVLLRFADRAPDATGMLDAARARGVPLRVVDIENPQAAEVYGRRLVLVRPDGHVAWRSDEPPSDPNRLLDTVRGMSA